MLALFINAEVTMFKFIHAADVHLDSPLRGLSRYESAPAESIRNACRRAFENLVDLAIEEKVAFVLLAGDLYDGDWKDYNTGIFLSQQMGRLSQHNILVFTVAGNHDAANRMTKALDSPTNMSILSSRKVETIKLDDLSVAIHGRSFGTQHVDEISQRDLQPPKKACSTSAFFIPVLMAEKTMRFMPLVQLMIFVPEDTNTGRWATFTNRSLF